MTVVIPGLERIDDSLAVERWCRPLYDHRLLVFRRMLVAA